MYTNKDMLDAEVAYRRQHLGGVAHRGPKSRWRRKRERLAVVPPAGDARA